MLLAMIAYLAWPQQWFQSAPPPTSTPRLDGFVLLKEMKLK